MKTSCAGRDLALFSELTVLENITLPLMIQGMSRAERDAKGEALLREMEMSYAAHCFPNSLSLYEQRAAVLGRAVIIKPEVLLLDGLCDGLREQEASMLKAMADKFRERFGFELRMDKNIREETE